MKNAIFSLPKFQPLVKDNFRQSLGGLFSSHGTQGSLGKQPEQVGAYLILLSPSKFSVEPSGILLST